MRFEPPSKSKDLSPGSSRRVAPSVGMDITYLIPFFVASYSYPSNFEDKRKLTYSYTHSEAKKDESLLPSELQKKHDSLTHFPRAPSTRRFHLDALRGTRPTSARGTPISNNNILTISITVDFSKQSRPLLEQLLPVRGRLD